MALKLKINDVNVSGLDVLVSPREVKKRYPASARALETVVLGRETIKSILAGKDDRLMVIVGPCSIHDPKAILDYARHLKNLSEGIQDSIFVVLRTYFEKPRTTIGWKGLINDPRLNGSFDIKSGVFTARRILLAINEMGLACASEALDPIIPQYLSDLVSWASIGARTIESQTHREMASGLSMPVGFKNSTDGSIQAAINAMQSATHKHHFLGIDQNGQSAVVRTKGNPFAHIVLRGGGGKTNFDLKTLVRVDHSLAQHHLLRAIIVDCSHDNSSKDFKNQAGVFRQSIGNILQGASCLKGLMLESNIHEGKQAVANTPSKLKYGVSITDACISWETTESLLRYAYLKLKD